MDMQAGKEPACMYSVNAYRLFPPDPLGLEVYLLFLAEEQNIPIILSIAKGHIPQFDFHQEFIYSEFPDLLTVFFYISIWERYLEDRLCHL